jgi:hypothetical protein
MINLDAFMGIYRTYINAKIIHANSFVVVAIRNNWAPGLSPCFCPSTTTLHTM